MERPTFNFAASNPASNNTPRGRRSVVPTEKIIHAKQMEADKAAKKAKKVAAATKRKPRTRAFNNPNTLPMNNQVLSASAQEFTMPQGNGAGATFNMATQNQSLPPQPALLPQPFPYMTLSEQQLAQLGAMFAQNHWNGSANVGVNYRMRPANFGNEEMQEMFDDPEADSVSNHSESDELQQMQSVAADELLSRQPAMDTEYNPPADGLQSCSSTLTGSKGTVGAPGGSPPDDPGNGGDDDSDDGDDDDNSDDDGNGNGGRKPKKRGFNGLGLSQTELRVARLSCQLYALSIVGEDAWPDMPAVVPANASPAAQVAIDYREELAVKKWFSARDKVQERMGLDLSQLQPTGDVIRLVKERDYWARGRFKSAASDGASSQFGLKTKPDGRRQGAIPALVAYNRERVVTLKTNDSYIFQDPTNVDKPSTIYRNALLEDVITKALFNNASKSIGFASDSMFDEMMPLPTIALAAAAVECAIDEYYCGAPKKTPFKGTTYCKVYHHHIRQLNLWHEHQPESLAAYQRALLKDVKVAASIDDPADVVGDRADVPVSRFS
ncbi:hypothetical protein VNI00_015208 [Paramarasmius palmivorus]|uniref:DUF6532 domain-containing protein n=1 Tax=Paramarasmius palmivorus TaxID=297713 RepID=A0AAW0BMG4_9AGAR